MKAGEAALPALARELGVQRSWTDAFGRERRVPRETIVAVVRALGAPLETPGEAEGALRQVRRRRRERLLDPVHVARAGDPILVEIRLAPKEEGAYRWRLHEVESKEDRGHGGEGRVADLDGRGGIRTLPLAPGLPEGRFRLLFEVGGRRGEALVIVAPDRAWTPGPGRHAWGIFLPLHALRREEGDDGAGHLRDLDDLAAWAHRRGADFVGTLPLLPAFLGLEREPFDPSPYAPVSRRFWGEHWLAPEGTGSAEGGPAERTDYRLLASRRLGDLIEGSRAFHDRGEASTPAFRAWLSRHPRVVDYARFRTACLRHGPWREWPDSLELPPPQDPTVRAFVHGQWRADGHMPERDAGRAPSGTDPGGGRGLYLDLPLGVHRDGYDTWAEPHLFAEGVSVGAPPDDFFTAGQDWGFPPMLPEALREDGHAHFLEVLRHHLRPASILRLDHVMGLHRLFWIPEGAAPRDGTYVRYPARELWSILCLASREASTPLIGEDLGTVPPEVRAEMRRRGVRRMHVFQLQARFQDDSTGGVPARSAASLNTHDAFPFAGWWKGGDIDARREMGLIGENEASDLRRERAARRRECVTFLRRGGHLPATRSEPPPWEVMAACQEHLAASPAEEMIVNLEDLWLEEEPQNVPGSGAERPNWRRRARHPLEELERVPGLEAVLRRVDRARKEDGP